MSFYSNEAKLCCFQGLCHFGAMFFLLGIPRFILPTESTSTARAPWSYFSCVYPVVNVCITMENHHSLKGKSTISMAIFRELLVITRG